MADPAKEAHEEQGLHDLVTMFTRSLMHENTVVPMSVAAKLAQFVSELYLLWRENKPLTAPQAALQELFVEAVSRNAGAATQNGEPPEENSEDGTGDPESDARFMTKRGTPRLTAEEVAARRRAVWTPEKRAEHRRRTLERMARQRQQPPRIPQSIPA